MAKVLKLATVVEYQPSTPYIQLENTLIERGWSIVGLIESRCKLDFGNIYSSELTALTKELAGEMAKDTRADRFRALQKSLDIYQKMAVKKDCTSLSECHTDYQTGEMEKMFF